MMHKRPGRAGGIGDRDARDEADPREQAGDARRHRRLAAEQMRDPGHVEEQCVRVGDRDDRRPAARERHRQAVEIGQVARRIGGTDIEPRHLRARLCQRHARVDAEHLRTRGRRPRSRCDCPPGAR